MSREFDKLQRNPGSRYWQKRLNKEFNRLARHLYQAVEHPAESGNFIVVKLQRS